MDLFAAFADSFAYFALQVLDFAVMSEAELRCGRRWKARRFVIRPALPESCSHASRFPQQKLVFVGHDLLIQAIVDRLNKQLKM